jgi:hypothetical protein
MRRAWTRVPHGVTVAQAEQQHITWPQHLDPSADACHELARKQLDLVLLAMVHVLFGARLAGFVVQIELDGSPAGLTGGAPERQAPLAQRIDQGVARSGHTPHAKPARSGRHPLWSVISPYVLQGRAA